MAEFVRASHPVFGTRRIPAAWLETYPGAWTVLDPDDPGPGPDPLSMYVRDVDLPAQMDAVAADDDSDFSARLRAAFGSVVAATPAIVAAAEEAVTAAAESGNVAVLPGAHRGAWSLAGDYVFGDLVEHRGQLWYAGGIDPVTAVRTNLFPNPETTTTASLGTPTGGTRTLMSSGGPPGVATWAQITSTGATEPAANTSAFPAEAGKAYTAAVSVKGDAGATAAVKIIFYLTDGTTITLNPTVARTALAATDTWERRTYTSAAAPAGTTRMRVSILLGGNTGAGMNWGYGAILVEEGTTGGAFFSGATADTATVDHAWTGTAHDSASTRTETSVPERGEPGDDPSWAPWAPLPAGLHRPARSLGAFVPAVGPAAQSHETIPAWLDATRSRVWNSATATLKESRDDGATWTDVHAFPASVGIIRSLANGEVLVSTTDPANPDNPKHLELSSGYADDPATATWTKVLTGAGPRVTFTSSWSIDVHDNIVLIAEYGPKVGTLYSGMTVAPGGNARYVYLSLDYGRTWTTVLDLNAHVTGDGLHLHGVAWDPYWDRIWVTFGDDQNGTLYSDDLGTTWEFAHHDTTVSGAHQLVGIKPMPTCVLFGTDCAPNGVHRIDRAHGKKTADGSYPIDVAFTINASAVRTHLCHQIFQADRPGGDAPVFFPFSAESQAAPSAVTATLDGWTFEKVWEDTVSQAAGKGLRAAVGPTVRGNLILRSDDERTPGSWTKFVGPSPGY